jgi:hypothetical protein
MANIVVNIAKLLGVGNYFGPANAGGWLLLWPAIILDFQAQT